MPIIHTNTFWDYIIDESPEIISKVIGLLTRKEFDFDTKKTNLSRYYNIINKFTCDDGIHKLIRFPGGLCKYISRTLNLQIDEIQEQENLYTADYVLQKAKEVQQLNSKFEIRDYQLDAVLTSVNRYRSLIHSCVGSGKTSMLSLVCKILKNDKILILNGNNFILTQIYERLLSFGETDVSWIQGKEPDYSKRIVLLNTSGSDSRLNRQNEAYINFLKEVNTIIWDEAHHIQSLTWFEPLFYTSTENLQHIIGYSGSPFREYKNPYENDEDFRTIALLGPRAFIYEMKDTIADKNIAEPHAYFISYKNKQAVLPRQFEDNYFMKYRMNIVYNKARNTAGIEMLKFLNKNGIKTLAAFNNKKPGQKIMKELKEQGINSLFQCGKETIYEYILTKRNALKLEERKGTPKDIRDALENDYNIIFGSTVMDEGIDLDVFQAVVIFSAGKTSISNIQRIGRASRKRKNGRNISFVIDFKDIGGERTCEEHYYKRRQMLLDSGVKILSDVQDFMKLIKEIGEENTKMEK